MIKLQTDDKSAVQPIDNGQMRVPLPVRFLQYRLEERQTSLQPWVEDWLNANAKGAFYFRHIHIARSDGIGVKSTYVIDFVDDSDGVYFSLWASGSPEPP